VMPSAEHRYRVTIDRNASAHALHDTAAEPR
jgi:hypothetical protein